MGRLTIDVTNEQHQSLKIMAALQGKTIKEYALEKLFPAHADEEQALTELKSLLEMRIAEAERCEIDTRSIMEIAVSVLGSGKKS